MTRKRILPGIIALILICCTLCIVASAAVPVTPRAIYNTSISLEYDDVWGGEEFDATVNGIIPSAFGKNVVKLTATNDSQILISNDNDVVSSAGDVVIRKTVEDKSEAVIEIINIPPTTRVISFTFTVKAAVMSKNLTVTAQSFNDTNTDNPSYAVDKVPVSDSAVVKEGIRVDTPDLITGYLPVSISGEVMNPTPIPANSMLIYMIRGENNDFYETRYMPYSESPDSNLFVFPDFNISTPNPNGDYRIEVILVDMTTGETLSFGDREVTFQRFPPPPPKAADPSGTVVDYETHLPIEGVTMTIYKQDANGVWDVWVPYNGQVNPIITEADGKFRWDVEAGTYRIDVFHPNYNKFGRAYESPEYVVPPDVTELVYMLNNSVDGVDGFVVGSEDMLKDTNLPAGESEDPTEQFAPFGEAFTVPGDEVSTSDDEVTPTDNEAAAQDDEATISDSEAMAPDNETVPTDDVTTTPDEEVAPTDDEATASDGEAAPPEDEALTHDDEAIASGE